MQTLLFIKSPTTGKIIKVLNIARMDAAWPTEDDQFTIAGFSGVGVEVRIPFDEFLSQVEALVRENHEYEIKSHAYWQNKSFEGAKQAMIEAMRDLNDHHH